MNIFIVEDEPIIAERIERLSKEILKEKITSITVRHRLTDSVRYLFANKIDLLILDLNLNGRDGFELLKLAVSGSFHTIIISAHTDKALEAFEYGVLDFIGKPFSGERLKKAFERIEKPEKSSCPVKYVSVRKNEKLLLIDIDDIMYIKGARIYTEIVLKDGKTEIHDKSLNSLCQLLPTNFVRIHKSYIANLQYVKSISSLGGSKYSLQLLDGETLPVSRIKYKEIKSLLP